MAALSTGCRPGGLLSLQWKQIQFDATGQARAFLLPANITTMSRYLRSTPLRLERALSLLEAAEACLFPTRFPHSADQQHEAGSSESEETLDSEELEVVNREGVEFTQAR